jgi:hypothetical protein
MNIETFSNNCNDCRGYSRAIQNNDSFGCGLYLMPRFVYGKSKKGSESTLIKLANVCVCGKCLIKGMCENRCEERNKQWK